MNYVMMVCQIFLSENVILMLILQTMSILSLNIDYPPGLSIYLSNGNKNLANHELNTMGGIWKHVIGLTPRQNCLWFQIFRKQIEDLKKSKISWNKTVLGKTGRIAQRSLFLFSYRLGIFINTTTNVTKISIKYKRHNKNSAIQIPLSKESINQDKDYLKVSEKSKNTTENVK